MNQKRLRVIQFVFLAVGFSLVIFALMPGSFAVNQEAETFPLDKFVLPSSNGSYWVFTKYTKYNIEPFLVCLGEKDIRPYWFAAPAFFTSEACN